MEVFNTSGESGMAVIHMDDKPAVRLKFQYRINISIVYSTNDSRFDMDPCDVNTLKVKGAGNATFPTTLQHNLIENLGVFGLPDYGNAPANDHVGLVVDSGQNLSSPVEQNKPVIIPDYKDVATPDYSVEKQQSSAFMLEGHSDSRVGDKPADCILDSDDVAGFFDSSASLKEPNIDKYRQVRENLNEIFQERRKAAHDNNRVGDDLNMGDMIPHHEVEDIGDEEDLVSDLGGGHDDPKDSDHQELRDAASGSCVWNTGSPDGSCEDENHSDFSCPVCQMVFKSRELVVEHQRASTVKIKCLVCKEECLSRAHLMLHDYVAHTSQGSLCKKMKKQCPLCQQQSLNDSDLVDHIKSKHTHEGLFKCCLCHEVFQTDNDYDLHTDICKKDKVHRKLIKSNKKLAIKVNRKATRLKVKPESKSRQSSERKREMCGSGNTKHRVVKKSKSCSPSNYETSKSSGSSATKIKITLKKQDKGTAKLKKAKLNAQYYQKLKQQRLLNKQREAEAKAANGDELNPAIIIERGQSTDETDSSWDKTWKCKFCDRIFMNMREFNSHNMPMRTKRVCTKCGDRSKSKAEYLLHQCKRETVEQEEGEKSSRGKRKCPMCEEEVQKKEILKHVMFQHTGEMPHLCCICGVPLESYDAWITHCETFHAPPTENDPNENKLFSHVSFTSSQNSSEIVCKLCKSNFYSGKDFVHHHKFETVRKVCNVCETATFTEAGYIVHRYLSHGLSPDEIQTLAIPSCYDTFNNNLWEEDKFGEWSNEGLPCVKCPCCPETVNTKDLFFHVMAMHTHESPFKCCACENVSPDMNHYIQHCDFHLGKRVYNNKTPRCLQCDLRFESRRALNSHKQFHQKRCPYCQMEFSSAVFLKIHLQNYHTNDMEACSFCGKLFACSTQLAEHERHHYFSKQSQCTVCGKLIYARNMAKHMKIAHPKSDDDCIFCAVCNKRFRDRHQMEQHQLCHSTDFTHECDVCQKKFKNGIRLREHAKVHLDKKRLFVCDICGKTCTEKYNLQVHMRVHSNTKEFHCPLCNQGFNYNQSLKSHMEKEHNKVSVGPQHFNCSFCNIPFGYIHTLEAHMREKHGYSNTNYGPASQWY